MSTPDKHDDGVDIVLPTGGDRVAWSRRVGAASFWPPISALLGDDADAYYDDLGIDEESTGEHAMSLIVEAETNAARFATPAEAWEALVEPTRDAQIDAATAALYADPAPFRSLPGEPQYPDADAKGFDFEFDGDILAEVKAPLDGDGDGWVNDGKPNQQWVGRPRLGPRRVGRGSIPVRTITPTTNAARKPPSVPPGTQTGNVRLSPSVAALVADATAAGFTVSVRPDSGGGATVGINRFHRGTGKPILGVAFSTTGTGAFGGEAWRTDVPGEITTTIRTLAEVRRALGVTSTPTIVTDMAAHTPASRTLSAKRANLTRKHAKGGLVAVEDFEALGMAVPPGVPYRSAITDPGYKPVTAPPGVPGLTAPSAPVNVPTAPTPPRVPTAPSAPPQAVIPADPAGMPTFDDPAVAAYFEGGGSMRFRNDTRNDLLSDQRTVALKAKTHDPTPLANSPLALDLDLAYIAAYNDAAAAGHPDPKQQAFTAMRQVAAAHLPAIESWGRKNNRSIDNDTEYQALKAVDPVLAYAYGRVRTSDGTDRLGTTRATIKGRQIAPIDDDPVTAARKRTAQFATILEQSDYRYDRDAVAAIHPRMLGHRAHQRWRELAMAQPSSTLPPDRRQPVGPPVSVALGNKVAVADRATVARTLALIDSVHGDGILDRIDLVSANSRSFAGQLVTVEAFGRDPMAAQMKLARAATDPEFTVAHEIGHWLDVSAINGPGRWESKAAKHGDPKAMPEMKALLDAIDQSAATAGIRQSRQIPPKMRAYYLSPHEQFARAYSQWIALRTMDPKMRRDSKPKTHLGDYQYDQWTDSDFAPIAAAMDALFDRLGWRK
jgi:hypothetical protein